MIEQTAEFVFISYSHDSPEHKDRVRGLAEQLFRSGVSAVLDQYNPFPAEGWPAWTMRNIRAARFVLVVATEPYYRRAMGIERPGTGLGAIWESQVITQELYETAGNKKYVPVIMDVVDEAYIPDFLRPYTRYNVARDDGFIGLLRLLTDQAEHSPPPLGPRIVLPVGAHVANVKRPTPRSQDSAAFVSSSGDAVLLHPLDDGLIGARSQRIEERAGNVKLTVVIDDARSLTAFSRIELRSAIGIAYGDKAFIGHVQSIETVREGDSVKSTLVVSPSQSDYGITAEPSFNDTSADEIAAMRARRILLDEPGPAVEDDTFTTTQLNKQTLELFIRGMSSPIRIARSPLPVIYDPVIAAEDPERFLMEVRVLAILFLRLSGTTEVVQRLDLRLNNGQLEVDFVGQRPQQYANREPYTIDVHGIIDLAARKAALALDKSDHV